MKKVILIVIAVVFFSGCTATDKIYGEVKESYKAAKVIYQLQPIKSPTLEVIGTSAEAYDEVRSEVRGQ